MDEDNEQTIKEPVIMSKQVDEDLYKEIKKKAEATKQKAYREAEKKLPPDDDYEDDIDDDEDDDDDEEDDAEAKAKEKANNERIAREAESQKNAYREMAERLNEERRARAERLESLKIEKEERKPNPKGELLRSVSYILYTVMGVAGLMLLITGNFMNAIIMIIATAIAGSICLGVSEIVSISQKIYDLLYYEYRRK